MIDTSASHYDLLDLFYFRELKLGTLSRRFAAVGGESRTRAEGCSVVCEKHDHLGNSPRACLRA